MFVIEDYTTGFCHGVRNALDLLDLALTRQGQYHIYLSNDIVHNDQVNTQYAQKGVTNLKLDSDNFRHVIAGIEHPHSAILVIGAHGLKKEIRQAVIAAGIEIMDATCPLVKRVFHLIETNVTPTLIYLGIRGHTECEAALSYHPDIIFVDSRAHLDGDPYVAIEISDSACLLGQTTISGADYNANFELARKRFLDLVAPDFICPVTISAEEKAHSIKPFPHELVLVIGGFHSANTQKLVNIFRHNQVNVKHINTENDLRPAELLNLNKIYLFSGTSTPPESIEKIKEYLAQFRDQ